MSETKREKVREGMKKRHRARGSKRESKRGRESLNFREGDGEATAMKETNCE